MCFLSKWYIAKCRDWSEESSWEPCLIKDLKLSRQNTLEKFFEQSERRNGIIMIMQAAIWKMQPKYLVVNCSETWLSIRYLLYYCHTDWWFLEKWVWYWRSKLWHNLKRLLPRVMTSKNVLKKKIIFLNKLSPIQ